jgi:hypothetical protein
MPASQRNDFVEKRRKERDAISPYNKSGRKEKMVSFLSLTTSMMLAYHKF